MRTFTSNKITIFFKTNLLSFQHFLHPDQRALQQGKVPDLREDGLVHDNRTAWNVRWFAGSVHGSVTAELRGDSLLLHAATVLRVAPNEPEVETPAAARSLYLISNGMQHCPISTVLTGPRAA